MVVALHPESAAVWIGTKRNLPLKLRGLTVTEKDAKSVVDGKIGEKEFELPKK